MRLHALGSEITKFADLSYLFWNVKEVEPSRFGINPAPLLAMKYSYQGDLLIIRTVRLSAPREPFSTRVDSDELHVIKPIYRKLEEQELLGYRPAAMNARFI
jgi:hypothetical protein